MLFNLIGALVIAYLLSLTGAFNSLSADNFLVHIVEGKFEKGVIQTLVEAMFANIIVNLAILMSMKAKDDMARFSMILCVIFIFTFLGFEHVIANFIYFPLAFFTSGGAVAGMTAAAVGTNIVLAFIGNFIGGGLVIGVTYAWLNKDLSVKYLD